MRIIKIFLMVFVLSSCSNTNSSLQNTDEINKHSEQPVEITEGISDLEKTKFVDELTEIIEILSEMKINSDKITQDEIDLKISEIEKIIDDFSNSNRNYDWNLFLL